MKTILVPIGGSRTDHAVFATAMAAARAVAAHLEFLHIRISPGEAAEYTPHVDFARGAALRDALGRLDPEAAERSRQAERHVRQLCEQQDIRLGDAPSHGAGLSAVWREELDGGFERLIYRARHSDMMVLGRAARPNGLPPDLIERAVLDSGRPVLVAPDRPPRSLTGTVLVCWKESAEAARALAASLPLLRASRRVVVVCAEEPKASLPDALEVVQQLAWHGVAAEAATVAPDRRSTAEALQLAARRYDADLMIMGAYGVSWAREIIFGGCTQSFIHHAERPILLMH